MSLEIIQKCISSTLIKGYTLDGNLIVVDPREHLNLFQPHIKEYIGLSEKEKIKIMDLFAGLTGIYDRIPITRREAPTGNISRFACSRKKKKTIVLN